MSVDDQRLMPTTDLTLLLCVVGLSPTDAERVSRLPLAFVLGYMAGVRQLHCDRAPWLQSPVAWAEWRMAVAVMTEAVRLVQVEYYRAAGVEKGEQQR